MPSGRKSVREAGWVGWARGGAFLCIMASCAVTSHNCTTLIKRVWVFGIIIITIIIAVFRATTFSQRCPTVWSFALPGRAATMDVCWICLTGPEDGNDEPLSRACGCPRAAHAQCIARWQLQQAGKRYGGCVGVAFCCCGFFSTLSITQGCNSSHE